MNTSKRSETSLDANVKDKKSCESSPDWTERFWIEFAAERMVL